MGEENSRKCIYFRRFVWNRYLRIIFNILFIFNWESKFIIRMNYVFIFLLIDFFINVLFLFLVFIESLLLK